MTRSTDEKIRTKDFDTLQSARHSPKRSTKKPKREACAPRIHFEHSTTGKHTVFIALFMACALLAFLAAFSCAHGFDANTGAMNCFDGFVCPQTAAEETAFLPVNPISYSNRSVFPFVTRRLFMNTTVYRVHAVPNPQLSTHQRTASGNVLAAVAQASQGVILQAADCRPGSVHIALWYCYDPRPPDGDPQSRLTIYIVVRAEDVAESRKFSVLLEKGPLSLFYRLTQVELCTIPWERMFAACHLTRQDLFTPAATTPETNPSTIPDGFYGIKPFTGRDNWDLSSLDRILDSLSEAALIVVAVEPTDCSYDQRAFSSYLARLDHSANPSRSQMDGTFPTPKFLGAEDSSRWTAKARTPRFMPDESAAGIRNELRHFESSLAERNVHFNIYALAASPETAEVLASIFADSCFEEGGYSRRLYSVGHHVVQDTVRASREHKVISVPTLHDRFPRGIPKIYAPLQRLSNLATVREMLCAFTLPIAPHPCLRTIHKDMARMTSPPEGRGRSNAP